MVNGGPQEIIGSKMSLVIFLNESQPDTLNQVCNRMAFVSQIKLKWCEWNSHWWHWSLAMQEQLNQFEGKKVWKLVSKPSSNSVIGVKWVFCKKFDENANV